MNFPQSFVHMVIFNAPSLPNVDNCGCLASPLPQFFSTLLLNNPLLENHTFQFNLLMSLKIAKTLRNEIK